MAQLQSYGAINIRDLLQMETNTQSSPRIRFNFTIPDQDKAIECYDFFQQHNERAKHGKLVGDFDLQEHLKIHLQLPEDVFVRYGDREAAIYQEMMQAMPVQEALPKRDRKNNKNNNRRGKFNETGETSI
mmetsp:Transcript_5682/g.9008  ORF Transcript_5682/g.9008 Transcript_5682/m.9008 type:complete len:130 (-) Transcript_5682:931-1320(-)